MTMRKMAAQSDTKGMLVLRMLGWMADAKKQRPRRKSPRASCRSIGRTATNSKTFQFLSPGYRKKRIRSWACGDVAMSFTARNSLSHYLTRIPNDAVMMLKIRLAIQKMLTLIDQEGDWKLARMGAVVPFSCANICAKSWFVRSLGSCWRLL